MKGALLLLEPKIAEIRKEIEKESPSQEKIHELSRDLYWIFELILEYHIQAEKKFGIEPPPEPPMKR